MAKRTKGKKSKAKLEPSEIGKRLAASDGIEWLKTSGEFHYVKRRHANELWVHDAKRVAVIYMQTDVDRNWALYWATVLLKEVCIGRGKGVYEAGFVMNDRGGVQSCEEALARLVAAKLEGHQPEIWPERVVVHG